MTTEFAFAAYRPRAGKDDELLQLLREDEYVAPAELEGADVPFARWTVVAEV
jgi:hypothetical protein